MVSSLIEIYLSGFFNIFSVFGVLFLAFTIGLSIMGVHVKHEKSIHFSFIVIGLFFLFSLASPMPSYPIGAVEAGIISTSGLQRAFLFGANHLGFITLPLAISLLSLRVHKKM